MIGEKRLTVIQVLLVLIFVGCCGYLGKYFYDSHKAESGFDELKKWLRKRNVQTQRTVILINVRITVCLNVITRYISRIMIW